METKPERFECFNCAAEKPASEAIVLSWPVKLGWLGMRAGMPLGSACRECRETVDRIGMRVTVFFAVVLACGALYFIAR